MVLKRLEPNNFPIRRQIRDGSLVEMHTILFSNLLNMREFQTLYGWYGLLLFTPFFLHDNIFNFFLFLFLFFFFFGYFPFLWKLFPSYSGKSKRSGITTIPEIPVSFFFFFFFCFFFHYSKIK